MQLATWSGTKHTEEQVLIGPTPWLRQGMDVYESWLFQLNDPLWDPIRDSPGFREILQELGLPEG